jgi:type IV pilus assembly protein PilB
MKRKKIGELLVKMNLITKPQLEEALEIQKKKGGFLGKILVSLNYITEEEIVEHLTEQHGYAYLALPNYEIDPNLTEIIPEELARTHLIVPIDRIGNLLTVAIANPLDSEIIDLIKEETGLLVQTFLSSISDLQKCIEECYGENHRDKKIQKVLK